MTEQKKKKNSTPPKENPTPLPPGILDDLPNLTSARASLWKGEDEKKITQSQQKRGIKKIIKESE